MGTVMRDDTSQRSHRLAVTQPVHPTTTTTRSPRTADGQGRGCAGPDEPCYPSLTALTGMWSSALYNRPRMGADAIGPTGRLAMTLRVTRVTSSLALARDRGYDGQRMGVDTVQPSRRLAHPTTRLPDTRLPDYPTTRLPDYPTTRLPDYPTTRLPDYPTTRLPDYPTTRLPDYPRRDYPTQTTRPTRDYPTTRLGPVGAGAERGTIDPRGTQPPRI